MRIHSPPSMIDCSNSAGSSVPPGERTPASYLAGSTGLVNRASVVRPLMVVGDVPDRCNIITLRHPLPVLLLLCEGRPLGELQLDGRPS